MRLAAEEGGADAGTVVADFLKDFAELGIDGLLFEPALKGDGIGDVVAGEGRATIAAAVFAAAGFEQGVDLDTGLLASAADAVFFAVPLGDGEWAEAGRIVQRVVAVEPCVLLVEGHSVPPWASSGRVSG